MTTRLEQTLDALKARNRLRSLTPARGLDFSSNDYLGLSASSALYKAAAEALERKVALGAGGSRLLRGNSPEHEGLEREAARFFGSEAALFMGGGFQANQAVFSCLPAAGDLVLYDALVHASAHEGMRLGRADKKCFRHNDISHASEIVQAWRTAGGRGQIWLVVESVYSMEGDLAPLRDLDALAQSVGAILVVDEAHATGLFGRRGCGLASDLKSDTLTLHTCGKALGVSGALLCGPRVMIDILINRARPFIFATAPPPLTAALVRAALKMLDESPELALAAWDRINHAHKEAHRFLGLAGLETQIVPVLVGNDYLSLMRAQDLQNQGFDVRAIRPPTVPPGTSRLRVSITGHVNTSDISNLFEAIGNQMRETSCPALL
ncbi:8-amino-7-oxononanoate synthase [Roseibium sp. RKSG952]|uniref:8-amino-7-oxononanoate synthase n=1 Tax=Roseibium sp. RKSG952 TaxID=2529384 RepID=UPI0012BBD43F|nr:8-amino-7-oxononanoate synthase [Roseibium sp. RKSG952]MTH95235.1 8-amino-7-oxononanoate synthase [Roseibium sp. RKSG952]